MARLPRYQESGLVAGDIPRLDFANLREESNVMQGIGNALDRVSQFAFGEAKKETDRVNKLTAIQVRSDLEAVVQKKIADLTVKVETNQITDYSQIQSEIQALSGLSSSLVDLDIDQANGLMSSIRTSGKALLAKSSDIMVKNYQAGLNVQLRELIDSSELNLQTKLEVNQDPNEFKIATGELRLKAYAIGARAGNADQAMKDFDLAAERARDNVMSKYFLSSEFATKPSEALAKLNSKDAGKFSQIWNGMTEQQQDKVRTRILKQSADLYSQQEREKKLAEDAAKAQGLDIRQDLYTNKISPQVAVKRLRAIGDIGREEMKALLTGDGVDGNVELFGRFESLVDQGLMGENAIDAYASAKTISWKQANQLKKMARGADKEFSQAVQFINSSLGVPDPLTPGFRNERKLAADAKSEFISRRDAAIKAGEAFDPIATAESVVKKQRESNLFKQIQADRERLTNLLGKAGIVYNENLTIDALNRIEAFTDLNARDRKRITDLMLSVGNK